MILDEKKIMTRREMDENLKILERTFARAK